MMKDEEHNPPMTLDYSSRPYQVKSKLPPLSHKAKRWVWRLALGGIALQLLVIAFPATLDGVKTSRESINVKILNDWCAYLIKAMAYVGWGLQVWACLVLAKEGRSIAGKFFGMIIWLIVLTVAISFHSEGEWRVMDELRGKDGKRYCHIGVFYLFSSDQAISTVTPGWFYDEHDAKGFVDEGEGPMMTFDDGQSNRVHRRMQLELIDDELLGLMDQGRCYLLYNPATGMLLDETEYYQWKEARGE